ncbi:hypothetical protein KJ742_03835 [Patescibacteria group bacterium]|nr:hypothetical protein [Patescibacteria group bacterium]MBU1683053.1 hypothetical protein [Patescibacteria group bacterium]
MLEKSQGFNLFKPYRLCFKSSAAQDALNRGYEQADPAVDGEVQRPGAVLKGISQQDIEAYVDKDRRRALQGLLARSSSER